MCTPNARPSRLEDTPERHVRRRQALTTDAAAAVVAGAVEREVARRLELGFDAVEPRRVERHVGEQGG